MPNLIRTPPPARKRLTMLERAYLHCPWLIPASVLSVVAPTSILFGDWSDNGTGSGSFAVAVVGFFAMCVSGLGIGFGFVRAHERNKRKREYMRTSRITRWRRLAATATADGEYVSIQLYRRMGMFKEPQRAGQRRFHAEREATEALEYVDAFLHPLAVDNTTPDAIALTRSIEKLHAAKPRKEITK